MIHLKALADASVHHSNSNIYFRKLYTTHTNGIDEQSNRITGKINFNLIVDDFVSDSNGSVHNLKCGPKLSG